MKCFYFVFAFAILITGCNKNSSNTTLSLSEDQLSETLRSDALFAKYVAAFTTFRLAVISEPAKKNISALIKAEIKAGKIQSLRDYKKSYIAKGGSPRLINAHIEVYLLHGKLKRKYKDIIEANPGMFARVVSKNIPNNI